MIKMLVKVVFVSLFLGGLISCSTTTEKPPEVTVDTSDKSAATDSGDDAGNDTGATTSGTEIAATFARNAISDPSSPLNQKVIYFDYDKSAVLAEYMGVVDNHARYLTDYPDVRIRLEGHTDERASREYNIALGERRAATVRRLLLLQGVSADQVSILSYGEELPAALGHDESAWAQNRRVEFVYEP